jgi:transcriptional regulator with XRE-family HTH domain
MVNTDVERDPSVNHVEVGDRIDFFRGLKKEKTGRKVKLKELAAAAHYKPRTGVMSQILKGESGIALSRLEAIAKELDVEVETLAYPGHIDQDDLILVDCFFKLLKHKRSPHFGMITDLIIEDATTITK